MRVEVARTLITYLLVSLMILYMFKNRIISLKTPRKQLEKYTDLLEVAFAIFWPALISVILNTFRNKKED